MGRPLHMLATSVRDAGRFLALIALGLFVASVAFPFLEADYPYFGPKIAVMDGFSEWTLETFWSFKESYYVKRTVHGESSTVMGDRWFTDFWSQTWEGWNVDRGMGPALSLIFVVQILTVLCGVVSIIRRNRSFIFLPAVSSFASFLLTLFVGVTLNRVYSGIVRLGFWFALLSTIFYCLSLVKRENLIELFRSLARKARSGPIALYRTFSAARACVLCLGLSRLSLRFFCSLFSCRF